MNVDVVIVTYNRLEKLKKALSCYENQTKQFRNLIVVNNHSNDGTFEFLEKWKNEKTSFAKYVVNMDDNLGGSGGFYAGQKYAMSLNPDWIYLADDDAYADLDMLEQFYKFCDTYDVDNLSAVCGTVYNMEGNISYQHRSTYIIKDKIIYIRTFSKQEDYEKEYFSIDFLSYVGSFLNVKALKRYGLVNYKYFIYYDDTEHSIRLKKYGDLICVPSIKIVHEENGGEINKDASELSWRNYYLYRNRLHMLKRHHFRVAIDRSIYMYKKVKGKKDVNSVLIRSAMKDAWLGRLGKHNIYRPGWTRC